MLPLAAMTPYKLFVPLLLVLALPLQAEGIKFREVSRDWGIDYRHHFGGSGHRYMVETMVGGVVMFDFDGDGDQDLFFVDGGSLPGYTGEPSRSRLFRNDGGGHFTDWTEKSGLKVQSYGVGGTAGDVDGDGDLDLYVTTFGGPNQLFRNNGDGTFTDVTDKAGVAGIASGTMFHGGATFFDYYRDGKLDLYVGGYVTIDKDSPRYCDFVDIRTNCPPSVYKGSPAILYHNNGDGTFTDVTSAAGIYQPEGKNLSVAAVDYDDDGWPDLFVANDGVNAYLYHNEHNGTFTEVGLLAGMALTGRGKTMAAMCMSLGDYDNDGRLDLYISDFQKSSDHIWHNDGKGSFEEVSDQLGITIPTHDVLSFGGGFFDYDNDGWLDLFIANGHVYPEVERSAQKAAYKQINSLFHNDGKGKFVEVTKQAGDGFQTPYVGRGAAFVDFDNDGNVDVVVANNGDPPLLLHNGGGTGNHFVNFKLVGTKSNRDAMGARVRIRTGALSQIREIYGGGSYLSQSDLRANFGVGQTTRIESVEVSWPSGQKQTFKDVEADKFYLVEEGKSELGLQHFGRPSPSKSPVSAPAKPATTDPTH
jgi:hypothetical protein